MTDQQATYGNVRIAGTIKLCPLCTEPYDDWGKLRRHVSRKHDKRLGEPPVAEGR
jgi:hypothetical protein